MKLEKIYDKKDTQAILVSNKDFLVLAFRGTETNSIKDIKTDLKTKLIHHKKNSQTKGKVHAGFSKAFLSKSPHRFLAIQKKHRCWNF